MTKSKGKGMKKLLLSLLLAVSLPAFADEYENTPSQFNAVMDLTYNTSPVGYYQESLITQATNQLIQDLWSDNDNKIAVDATIGPLGITHTKGYSIDALGAATGVMTTWVAPGPNCVTAYGSSSPYIMHIVAPSTGNAYCITRGSPYMQSQQGGVGFATGDELKLWIQHGEAVLADIAYGLTPYLEHQERMERINVYLDTAILLAARECKSAKTVPAHRDDYDHLVAFLLGAVVVQEEEEGPAFATTARSEVILASGKQSMEDALTAGWLFGLEAYGEGLTIEQIGDWAGDILRDGGITGSPTACQQDNQYVDYQDGAGPPPPNPQPNCFEVIPGYWYCPEV